MGAARDSGEVSQHDHVPGIGSRHAIIVTHTDYGSMSTSTFKLANGAQLGYKILGAEHLEEGNRPLVLVNGMSMRLEDWDVLAQPLSRKRPSKHIT